MNDTPCRVSQDLAAYDPQDALQYNDLELLEELDDDIQTLLEWISQSRAFGAALLELLSTPNTKEKDLSKWPLRLVTQLARDGLTLHDAAFDAIAEGAGFERVNN